jgi:hypothetical protein
LALSVHPTGWKELAAVNALLFSLLLGGLIEPKPHAPAITPNPHTETTAVKSIVVVADGSRTWSGAASDAIIERLRSELGQSWSVHVARFDVEPSGPPEIALKGSNKDLVQVRPRTPMKEAIALAMNERAHVDGLSAIVVIARGQLYPTYVRTEKLASALRQSNLPVYTIHLTGVKHRGNVLRRICRGISTGAAWAIEALIEEDREVYSTKDTGRVLNMLSDATGGKAYTALNQQTGLLCATSVAGRITESGDDSKRRSTRETAGQR